MSAKPDGWLLRDPTLRKLLMTGGRLAPLGATKVKPLARLDVFPPDVTLTSPAPAVVRALVTAVIDVLPDTTTFVAATPPMVTEASLPKPLPLMVTRLPPVVLPVDGETEETFKVVDDGPDGESDPQPASRNGSTAASSALSERESVRRPDLGWTAMAVLLVVISVRRQ
jgi:hypothetical protein